MNLTYLHIRVRQVSQQVSQVVPGLFPIIVRKEGGLLRCRPGIV